MDFSVSSKHSLSPPTSHYIYMHYTSVSICAVSRQIIHCDVATRNILITDRGICKITDFGLARVVEGEDAYERTSKCPLPIRWMAPESLVDGRHSTKSDVWAYGILLWEIATLGASPYPGMAAKDVFRFVNDGRKMSKPEHCTSELYELMCECWSFLSVNRPSFASISLRMEDLLEKEGDYIKLDMFQSDKYQCLDSEIIDERL
ncbi:tyrosine kinase receptor Cad96Ca [Aplysia californica]|uniref:Tyrosine kinase receptor Cad96Ca n=1 Tax=Aplysia californica TaxID=6500 RepID=A0ABM1A9B1_APLCA|nr:tyrosine kinase receptor Cad96Ca [Aplysia californica]